MKKTEIGAAGFLAMMYTVGTVGHLGTQTRPLMLMLTPYVLLLLGLLPLAMAVRRTAPGRRGALLGWIAGTYVLTFALEAIGVATSLVFGGYRYGGVLGPRLFEVPLVIGFNWVLIVAGIIAAVDHAISALGWPARLRRPLASAVVVGLLTVLFDWVMEPVAIRLDYWTWDQVAVPLQNYLAWFVISAVATAVFRILRLRLETITLTVLVGVQLVFFAILNLGLS